MSSKEERVRAIVANFSPYRYEVNDKNAIPTKNTKVCPFVIKSDLNSNCKRLVTLQYEKTSTQKPDPEMKKGHCYKRRSYVCQNNKVKEKLFINSSIHV